ADCGGLDNAEKTLAQALTLWQKLADDFPGAPQYRFGLATTYNDTGVVLRGTRRHAEAENGFRQAQTLLEKLADDYPAVPEYRHHLARSRYNLGNLLEFVGRPREAEKPLRQAQALYEKLADTNPLDLRWEQAVNLNTLALVLKATGHAGEAREVYDQTIALSEKLPEEPPHPPECPPNPAGTRSH